MSTRRLDDRVSLHKGSSTGNQRVVANNHGLAIKVGGGGGGGGGGLVASNQRVVAS